MQPTERPLSGPLAALLATWLIVAAVSAWSLWPLSSNSQFWLISWVPCFAAGLAAWRWPWREPWQWQVDHWSLLGILAAMAACGLTLWFAEPVLLSLASLFLGLVICRGVVSENRWPLRGAWLPLVFPLVLLFGLDGRLTRWHDGVVQEEVVMLLDGMAFPNDGIRTLPTDQLSQSYVIDYSGNPWTSWGNVMALGLIVGGLARRRGPHGLLLMASGLAWSIILNVVSLIWPFAIRRFAGPINSEPLLTESWTPWTLIGAVLLLLTADQFLRFLFSEVEQDEDDESMSARIARFWNRWTRDALTSRQSQRLRRGEIPRVFVWSCLGITALLGVVFAWRVQSFYVRQNPQFAKEVDLNFVPSQSEGWKIEAGEMERRGAGSRLGTRSWRWVIGGPRGPGVLTVDESVSAQRDLLHQLRMINWRIASVESESVPRESTTTNEFDWSVFRLEKPKDALASVRHRGLLIVAAARTGVEGQRHPTVLMGRFPNWSGIPLVGTRWEGRLRRSSVLVWLLAEGFQEYTADEIAAWEALALELLNALPELK